MSANTYRAINVQSTNGLFVDTFIQDSSSKIVDFYFKKLLGLTSIAINTSVGDRTITLVNDHGFQQGEYISLLENDNASQFKVINVLSNVITLDSPLDYAYTILAEVRRSTINMNVNGSITPVIFNVVPSFKNKWHINSIVLSIEDNTEMDSAKFGGVTALTNGIVIKRVNGINHNICNIKTNGEFRVRHFQVIYDDKAPSGVYGLCACKNFNSQNGNGSAIYLNGYDGDEIQIIIQDDLSTLNKFVATVQGHYVIE